MRKGYTEAANWNIVKKKVENALASEDLRACFDHYRTQLFLHPLVYDY
jgi:hypothetical protein